MRKLEPVKRNPSFCFPFADLLDLFSWSNVELLNHLGSVTQRELEADIGKMSVVSSLLNFQYYIIHYTFDTKYIYNISTEIRGNTKLKELYK